MYQPKASMCQVCINRDKDCSDYDFESMSVMKVYPSGEKQVRCNHFVKADKISVEETDIFQTREYQVITDFYNIRTANRSGVPLMNHINEGIAILKEHQASFLSQQAFCLHPIVQNNENIDVSWSKAYSLAIEYRDKANSYLCKPETDFVEEVHQLNKIIGEISTDCVYMLIADKRQNYKDFIAYHRGSHVRTQQLERYFNIWLSYLHQKLSKVLL